MPSLGYNRVCSTEELVDHKEVRLIWQLTYLLVSLALWDRLSFYVWVGESTTIYVATPGCAWVQWYSAHDHYSSQDRYSYTYTHILPRILLHVELLRRNIPTKRFKIGPPPSNWSSHRSLPRLISALVYTHAHTNLYSHTCLINISPTIYRLDHRRSLYCHIKKVSIL